MAKRADMEKKREYAAMLQEQMALKKRQNEQQQPQLPMPDQLYDQQRMPQAQPPPPGQYPPGQQVDFGPPPSMMHQQPPSQYQPFEPPKYSMNQQVNFEPQSMMMPVSASYNQAPSSMMPPPSGMHGGPSVSHSYDPYAAQAQQRPSSRSPRHVHPNAQTTHENKEAQMAQQRSKQDEYRRELEQQMKLNEEKKRKMKEDQERYDMMNDKDMAQYLSGQPPPSNNNMAVATGGFGPPPQQPQQQFQMPPPPGGGPSQQASVMQGGGGQQQQPSGVRLASDITKRQEEVDPAKQQAKMRYQEEIRQQMEEAKARKEAAKLKEKQADEELERRIQGEQQRLAEQEVAEIKKEGGKPPEIKQPAKKIFNDAFKTSNDADRGQAAYQEPQPSTKLLDPPTLAKADQFVRPEPIAPQPLQLPTDDNFTLQARPPASNDLFGHQPPASMLPPEPGFQQNAPMGPGGFGGPPPPGGLQSPFNQQQNNTNYSQFGPPPGSWHPQPPGSAPLSNQQMSTQSDWMAAQSNQASKMFEDQQKMIGMYQQALEQILQYRNQYFEQAMQMRENILKEREQLLEHEKMKAQQINEMNQLKAVQSQLGTMLGIANQQAVLNPAVTGKLNSYITKQKEQILQMSQSSQSMSQLIQQSHIAQQQAQQLHQVPPQAQFQPPTQHMIGTPMSGGELPVTSQRVEIPRQSHNEMPPPLSNPQQVDFNPPQEESNGFDLQKQVDDLAAQIAANDVDQQQRLLTEQQRQRLSGQYPTPGTDHSSNMLADVPASNYGEFQRNPQFEQSLSSESKMVKVPNQTLLTKAASLAEENSAAKKEVNDMLIETWNEQSATKHLQRADVISPTRDLAVTPTNPLQLQDQSRLVTPKRIAGNLIVNPRSPLHQSSMPPTIQELPQEEEKPQNNIDGMRASGFDFQNNAGVNHTAIHDERQSIYDLNNRDLMSGTSSPPRAQMVSIEQREEMEKIERLVQQQTQSAWADRRATMTGTSFYDVNRQTQKIQEQTQQEEMQKQLMRILGSSSQSVSVSKEDDPLKHMQQAYGPETDRENNAKEADQKTIHSSTVKVRASQDLLTKQSFKLDGEGAVDLQEETKNHGFNPLETNQQPSSNQTGSDINIAATDQSGNLRKMQEVAAAYGKEKADDNPLADMTKGTFQPSELNDQSRMTDPQAPSDRKQWDRGQDQIEERSQQQEASIWDDRDLVPVMPVLPQFSDNSVNYEVQGNDENDGHGSARNQYRQIPPSANGNQPYFNGASITHTDKTLVGLQQMVPELIATDEFVVQTVQDETTGEERVQLSSKSQANHLQQQQQQQDTSEPLAKQHFQTYKQSEPMNFDEGASKVAPSAAQVEEQSSVIPTQIGQSNADEAGLVSARSRKEQEMAEIEDIIRKVTNTAKVTDQREKELAMKKLHGGASQSSWAPQSIVPPLVGTPSAPSSGKHALITDTVVDTTQMQTAAPNMAPHRLGQMQRAAEVMQPPPPVVNNDQQILSDLDKIIANLEMQQKNMATFGIPQPPTEDPVAEDQLEEEEGQKSARSQWTSLSKARDDRAQNNNKAAGAGKAPLDPKSARPKSGRSVKSRNASAKGGRSGVDASPQRVGKYAMMALQQQPGAGANGSPSPQKIGKFAQMALQNTNQQVVGTEVDNISQKYGRNPSRERLEERSQMSAKHNESRISNNVQQQYQTSGKASPSPQRIGKFAQLALQQQANNSGQQQVPAADLETISQKYGRNPSRERLEERSMISQANESRFLNNNTSVQQPMQNLQNNPSGPILRPVSGKSNNSRYSTAGKAMAAAGGRPPSNMVQTVQHEDQASNMGGGAAFRETTRTADRMTVGTVVDGPDRRGSQKLAYYSDEDDDVTAAHGGGSAQKGQHPFTRQQFSESGRTQQTSKNAQAQFNIRSDDPDNVNL